MKSRVEQLREWEAAYGSLPVWMGLRESSARPRSAEDASVILPQKLADQEHDWQGEFSSWLPGHACPRYPFPAEVFYIVLFSGHRREGDIATEIWQQDFGGRQCWPICLDLCIDQTAGNLCSQANLANLDFWKSRIFAKQVVGMHASPPCETYSEARFLPLEDESAGPRPLRTWSFPWGLPSLTAKELKQCRGVTQNFCFTAMFMIWFTR